MTNGNKFGIAGIFLVRMMVLALRNLAEIVEANIDMDFGDFFRKLAVSMARRNGLHVQVRRDWLAKENGGNIPGRSLACEIIAKAMASRGRIVVDVQPHMFDGIYWLNLADPAAQERAVMLLKLMPDLNSCFQ
jgi:hypothetical protein